MGIYFFSNSPVKCRFTKVVLPTPPSPHSTSLNSGPAPRHPVTDIFVGVREPYNLYLPLLLGGCPHLNNTKQLPEMFFPFLKCCLSLGGIYALLSNFSKPLPTKGTSRKLLKSEVCEDASWSRHVLLCPPRFCRRSQWTVTGAANPHAVQVMRLASQTQVAQDKNMMK